jgi:hypothetical protein
LDSTDFIESIAPTRLLITAEVSITLTMRPDGSYAVTKLQTPGSMAQTRLESVGRHIRR